MTWTQAGRMTTADIGALTDHVLADTPPAASRHGAPPGNEEHLGNGIIRTRL